MYIRSPLQKGHSHGGCMCLGIAGVTAKRHRLAYAFVALVCLLGNVANIYSL